MKGVYGWISRDRNNTCRYVTVALLCRAMHSDLPVAHACTGYNYTSVFGVGVINCVESSAWVKHAFKEV